MCCSLKAVPATPSDPNDLYQTFQRVVYEFQKNSAEFPTNIPMRFLRFSGESRGPLGMRRQHLAHKVFVELTVPLNLIVLRIYRRHQVANHRRPSLERAFLQRWANLGNKNAKVKLLHMRPTTHLFPTQVFSLSGSLWE